MNKNDKAYLLNFLEEIEALYDTLDAEGLIPEYIYEMAQNAKVIVEQQP